MPYKLQASDIHVCIESVASSISVDWAGADKCEPLFSAKKNDLPIFSTTYVAISLSSRSFFLLFFLLFSFLNIYSASNVKIFSALKSFARVLFYSFNIIDCHYCRIYNFSGKRNISRNRERESVCVCKTKTNKQIKKSRIQICWK